MNLSRAFHGLLSSSQPKKWLLLRPIAAFQSSLSTEATTKRTFKRSSKSPLSGQKATGSSMEPPNPTPQKDLTESPRPSEIPWQAKVANSVHLVGSVGVPVQLDMSKDGIYSAVSVLVNEKTRELPQFWIPIIFQGDLAQTAACHLREKDIVYVTGQLSGNTSPITINDAQAGIMVLVNSVSFVQNTCPKTTDLPLKEQDEGGLKSLADTKVNDSILALWNDLLANPDKWWDNRGSKFPTSAEFKHKVSGQLLWINKSTPEWVLSRLDTLASSQKIPRKSQISANGNKAEESPEALWSDLVVNPQNWVDKRTDKLNGKVKPKYPDFIHKETQQGLWLNTASELVIWKLNGLVFDNIIHESKPPKDQKAVPTKENKRDSDLESWKNLVENPNKWWDNRSNKLNPKYPDFKHKDTGEGLWLRTSMPSWVLSRLPPVDSKQKGAKQKVGVWKAPARKLVS